MVQPIPSPVKRFIRIVIILLSLTMQVYGQTETNAPVTLVTSTEDICLSNPYFSLTGKYENNGSLGSDITVIHQYSEDGIVWTTFYSGVGCWGYRQRPANLREGWYRVAAVRTEEKDIPEKWIISEPRYIQKVEGGCTPFARPWPDEISDAVCPRGTLLFREDFGGNNPSDPITSSTRLTTMSSRYHQANDVQKSGPSSGWFVVAKYGWQNGLNLSTTACLYSQWFIQDDHTYPNDYTRGYMLEVDGVGGNDAFYTTTFPVCQDLNLSFSAYVANVLEPGHAFAKPKVRFLIQDEMTGDTILEQSSGEIEPAPTDYGQYGHPIVQSAPWHLIGASFHVPAGVSLIRLSIYNDVSAFMGNDFAMDDIEIRLCKPEVTVEGDHELCLGAAYTFTSSVTADGGFKQPYNYLWQYATDSLAYDSDEWTNIYYGKDLSFDAVTVGDEGWYRLCVTSNGVDVETERYCRAMSEPFHLSVKECVQPPQEDLCMDGVLLFREDFGGNDVDDPIVGDQKVPGMDYSRYTQRTNADHVTGQPGLFWLIKSGYYHADTTGGKDPMSHHSNWYLQDDHTYPNDKTRGYLLEIDGLGGRAPFYSTVVHDLCPATKLTFSAYVANVNKASNYIDGVHARIYPRLRFELEDANSGKLLASHSTGDIPYDSTLTVNTDFLYSSKWYLHGMNFTVPQGVDSIRMTIYNDVVNNGSGNDFALDDIEIRLCMPKPEITSDHTACLDSVYEFAVEYTNDGTLEEPLEYKWWFSSDSVTWIEKSGFIGQKPLLSAVQKADSGWYKVAVSGAGNIERVNCRAMSEPFLLNTIHCQGPIMYENRDTTVCDTLMPFIWNKLLFSEPGTQTTVMQNQWGFDSLQTNWTLHTQICYPAIRHITCDTTVCHEDSITYRGHTYAAPGVYTDTVFNPTSTDTIYHLTVTDSRSFHDFSITITAGNPPPPPWEYVTESGVYRDTLLNAAGCDSIVTCSIYFRERCVERMEEYRSICAGDTLEWRGREFSEEGEYRDTLWHSMPEACDTAVLMHLHVLPTYSDTTFAEIKYGEEYLWEGEKWSEPTMQTRRYTATNSCDSLVTLLLSVDYGLEVEQMELESGCVENEQMQLYLLLSRPVDSVRLRFSDEAKVAGLRDSIVYFHAKEGAIIIPHKGAHPGTFVCEIALVHNTAVLYTDTLMFTLLYPSSVMEQAWNDVVAVLTRAYNGGYDFVAFQWYENGELLEGENHSYLYKPLIMGGEYSALLTESDGTQSMTCPLIATHQEDISLYPTIIGPHQLIRCYVANEAQFVLYDALGRVVGRLALPAGETRLEAPGVTGVYIATLIQQEETKARVYKLIVR